MNVDSLGAVRRGVVLAGGQSTRFGGPKMLAPLGDRSMIEHVVSVVTSYIEPVVISVRSVEQVPGGLRHRCRVDAFPGYGPAGALLTCLDSDGWTLVVAGDLPTVTVRELDALCRHVEPERGAVIAVNSAGRPQPLLACYPPSSRTSLEASLASGNLSMSGFVDRLDSVAYVTLPDDALRNVNRREDLPSDR